LGPSHSLSTEAMAGGPTNMKCFEKIFQKKKKKPKLFFLEFF
jgi:hypothetical protein